jgi:hypothetical protein
MRRASLLWIAPAVLFLLFGRVHLARILIPLFPGALLPLAFWASRARKRDVALAGIVVASHLSMLAAPELEARLRGPSPARRVSHYVSHLGMFRDHSAIQNDTAELIQDAKRILREEGDGRRTVVVIGADVLAYEFLLACAHPGVVTRTVFQSEGVQLRSAEIPEWEHRWFFLHPRWDRDPEEGLIRGDVPPDALRHLTPWERRTRLLSASRDRAESHDPSLVGRMGPFLPAPDAR